MKKSWISLALLVVMALPLSASAQLKIGTVNLKRIFENYYKTKMADTQLKDSASEFEKQRKELLEGYTKANEEYKKALDGAGDQAISNEERDRRKKAAEDKLREIQVIEDQINKFDAQAKNRLTEQRRRMRDGILEEIKERVNERARAGAYTMILDTSAESIANTPMIVYTNGENDLSDEVLTRLNQDAPVDFLRSTESTNKPGSVLRNLEPKAPAKDDKRKR